MSYQAKHARRRQSRPLMRTLLTAGLGAGLTVAGAGSAFAAGDYTVKRGDTLSEIAQANGVSWQRLARINDLRDPDLILIGQQLRLDGVERATSRQRVAKTERKSERVRRTTKSSRSDSSNRRSVNLSGAWRLVAKCESGGNPRAVNPAGYYGLFQFDRRTWRSVGGTGNPANASPSEQLSRAKRLYSQRGAQPWPNCGRYLR